MKKFFLLIGLILVFVFKPQNSFAQTVEIDAKTFMLSNESPGYLIDNLIANGYGDSSLYAVMQYLQPLSGGAIPQWFMDSLAACPAKSDIFTAELWNFSDPSNNPIGIAEDGTLVVAPIYGSDLSGKEGYTTYNDTLVPVSLKLFTEAIGPEFYIDAAVRTADGIKTYYQVFAIAWSLGSTFVLTNEGGLIDDLIRAGNGDKNLYQTLQILKPKSGGVITDEFMATLANCPKGSEIFTAALSNFSANWPVAINTDGSVFIAPVYGNDYFNDDGYNTNPENQKGYVSQLFTYATSPTNYINAGQTGDGSPTTYYKAFAIAWKASTTFVLTNEGGLIDDLIRAGHGIKNLYQTLEILKPKSGGIISDEFMATLAKCPVGSDIFTAALSNFGGLNNPVCVNTDGTLGIRTIFGKDYSLKDEHTTLPLNQNGYTPELFTHANSAENYIDAGASSGLSRYKAFAIAWKASTTFVLSNEGGLIDDLIRAGNGDKNLYQTLEVLKPKSGGVISVEFMAALANCPAGSEIFNTQLNNYTGFNNPVCINTDGTCNILGIFGNDYLLKDGFSTIPLNQNGYTPELFTHANSAENYIDAGASSGLSRYKAFAIAWKAATTFVLTNEGGLIDDLIRAGHGTKNLYQTLEVLKPKSGGVISDDFMAALANCPAGSEVFTASLNNYTGINSPVGINSDGSLIISPIFGKDFLNKTGYSMFPENKSGYIPVFVTCADSVNKYIDTGSSIDFGGYGNYKAFAIAWKAATTFVLTNEGGLIDDLIRAGNGDKNLYQTLEVLKPKSGGVISDEFMATLAKCPAGSKIFTAVLNNFSSEYNNPIGINSDGTLIVAQILGKNYLQLNGYNTFPDNQPGYAAQLFTYANSADKYIDAGTNVAGGVTTYYKAFAIAWKASTTFVLTNEGGLIDDLIRAGHGTKNLYQTLEILKPKSSGVISDEFMATLANCPAGSEIFITQLNNYTGLNNPVCINTDGTCNILGIFGKDYHQKTGYYTWPEQSSSQKELFTVSNDINSLIEAGFLEPNYYYKAFAICWSDSTVSSIFDNDEKNLFSVSPNPAIEFISISNYSGDIEILNIYGSIVWKNSINSKDKIDISSIQGGIYFIKTKNSINKFMVVR